MEMWFYQSTNSTILFEEWKTRNPTQYAFSCVAVFVMAVVYELMKVGRVQFDEYLKKKLGLCPCDMETEGLINGNQSKD
eukprot:m.247111 g.247111  ORF g.247111 m.247111 type:complete len:79 (-) comp76689_c0_seq1:36-272(-)